MKCLLIEMLRPTICHRPSVLITALTVAMMSSITSAADKQSDANFYGDFRLRYESVSQDNLLRDADALTLRARLGYITETVNGFSAVIEGEATVELIDDFSVPPAGVRTGQYSVVADPESEEIDQAYVQYAAKGFTVKAGRQVFTLDGHRFVGHVGWRQDRQTFDGVVVNYKPSDKLTLNASYIAKRKRIFADEADLDSEDIILNTSYRTSFGKLTGYAYLLEVDNGLPNSLDTYGISLSGSKTAGDTTLLYTAELATQETNDLFDTEYLFLEGGAVLNGITAKLGYELLGSDNGQKGFDTPLATLHKFNGWADQFLVTPNAGLEDIYLSVAGKLAGGRWLATVHKFSADESINGADDLGDEVNVQYSRKISEKIVGGAKLAAYSAGNTVFGKVDTDKFWLWASLKF
ncbi:MAG: alginate export family protein [Arenicella sp.]|nr:alginate export family protein [Arenicella sp.]